MMAQQRTKKFEKILSELNGSTGSYPFGPEALVFKVMGKMFALVTQQEDVPRITLKCMPANGEILTGDYKSVNPGYHMNKKHWITITLTGELSEEMIIDLIDDSYRLVVSKLTKSEKHILEQ